MKSAITLKRMIAVFVVSGLLFACKGNKTDAAETRVLSAADSAQLKEFQKWKERTEQPAKRTVVYRDAESRGSSASTVPATAKKKGWSKAAQGAVIGGMTGVVAGAIINKKNRAAGAVIGGVIGAGVGYGIGRAKDKKDGRY